MRCGIAMDMEAEKLLIRELKKHYSLFSKYGKDALLLSEISDNNVYPNPSIILKIQFFIL